MPRQPNDPSKRAERPQQPIKEVRVVSGDAIFVQVITEPPTIPDGKGRPCPQCHKTAWAESRWCWYCGYDFDRAAIPRICKTKLIGCSLAAVFSSLLTTLLMRALGSPLGG